MPYVLGLGSLDQTYLVRNGEYGTSLYPYCVTATSTKWGLAEGRVGTDKAFATYILLANPSTTTAAQVRVTYLRANGSTIVRTYTVNPTSRFNIDVNSARPGVGGGHQRPRHAPPVTD